VPLLCHSDLASELMNPVLFISSVDSLYLELLNRKIRETFITPCDSTELTVQVEPMFNSKCPDSLFHFLLYYSSLQRTKLSHISTCH
jgi:hypothetical protein